MAKITIIKNGNMEIAALEELTDDERKKKLLDAPRPVLVGYINDLCNELQLLKATRVYQEIEKENTENVCANLFAEITEPMAEVEVEFMPEEDDEECE